MSGPTPRGPLGPILVDAEEFFRRVVYSPAYATKPARIEPGLPLLLGYHGLAVLLHVKWHPDPVVTVETRALAIDGNAWRIDVTTTMGNRQRYMSAVYRPDRLVRGEITSFVDIDLATETRSRRGKRRHPIYALTVMKVQTAQLVR